MNEIRTIFDLESISDDRELTERELRFQQEFRQTQRRGQIATAVAAVLPNQVPTDQSAWRTPPQMEASTFPGVSAKRPTPKASSRLAAMFTPLTTRSVHIELTASCIPTNQPRNTISARVAVAAQRGIKK